MNKFRQESLNICLFLIGTTLLSGGLLLSTNTNASNPSEQVYLNILSSCTIGGSGTNSHTASTQGNEYISDIGTTTLSAFCNDPSGFAIYAVGFTDDEVGKTVLTDSSLGSTYDIVSGTATSGNVSNWAMKLAITQDTNDTTNNPFTIDNSFNEYHTVPATYTKVAHKDNNTDMTSVTGGVKLTTTYAAFATAVQPAGTYTGQVKYTLVHPATEIPPQPITCASGYICYYSNSNTTVGTMGRQAVDSTATSASLITTNYSRSGYGFAGWNDQYDYSGNIYGPSEDITFEAGAYTGSNDGLSLYAIWVPSEGLLQDTTRATAVCNGLTQSATDGTKTMASVSALTDQRDGQTYAIAKLADGQCWTIENLRLEDTVKLTLSNTNNPLNDGSKVTLKHNYGDAVAYETLSPNSTTAFDADTDPSGWCSTNTPECYDQSRFRNTNTADRATYSSTGNLSPLAALYSYGNYYNWYSATAGHGTYGFNVNNTSTPGDLCPAGWRLPRGGNKNAHASSDYWNLEVVSLNHNALPNNYNDTTNPSYRDEEETAALDAKLRAFPNNFLHSGFVNINGSIGSRGSTGDYWSSTTNGNYYVYHAYLNKTSGVYPGTYVISKFYGRTIRCIKQ